MRAEADAHVSEPEEPDACSGARRRDVDDEVTPFHLERPVRVRAPARVPEHPLLSGAPSRRPDRRVLPPPRRRGPPDEEHESRLVRSDEQCTRARGVSTEDGGGETRGDVALERLRRCAPRRAATAGGREREQQQAAGVPSIRMEEVHATKRTKRRV